MSNIHPTAIIEEGAVIGENVTIEPYAIIKSHVVLKEGVTIKAHAYIDGYTTIGEGSVIWPSASIGTQTQDLKYQGEKTFVRIGKNCHIREFVTINSSCHEGSAVTIGDNCLIMACCHVAHNCEVGDHVIMSNGVLLAGHVQVEPYAVIGGATAVHQFSRIGTRAMVGGCSRVARDIPPYTIGAGSPYELGGLNLVGLQRHGISLENRRRLSLAFKLTYRTDLGLEEALSKVENEIEVDEYVRHWIDFCRSSKRGIIGLRGAQSAQEEDLLES